MNKTATAIAIALACAFAAQAENPTTARAPKALVIMLDGQRGDTLDNGLAPNLRRLADGQWQPGYNCAWSLWAGTIRDGTTESSPNHVAIATGMTVAKSHIDWNPDLIAHPTDEAKLPTWLTRLVRKRAGTKALFITAWKTDLHISPSYDVKIIMDREGECPKDLVKILSEPGAPDAIMWYCGIPDEAGHAHGYYPYSPEYRETVREADGWVGEVLSAIAARPTFDQEDWLIAVTADHGGWERSHGQSSTACYTIPLLFAGRHVAQGRMPGVPRNYDIAPTVLTHFGVDISGIDFDGRVRGNDAPVMWPSRPLSDGLAVSLAFNGDAANQGAADVTAELRGAAVLIPDGVSGGALRVSPSADAAGSAFLKGSENLKFDNGNEFTFAAWVRVPGPQIGNPVVFANKDWRDGTNPGVAFAASQGVDMSRVYPGHYDYKKRGNHKDFMFNCGRDGGKREDLGVYKPVHGQWAFYAATCGSDGVARFYQGTPDGTLYCIADDLSDIVLQTGLPFSIGQDGTGAFPDAFVGDIDEFAIWTRTLSHEDVRRFFEDGLRTAR